MQQGRGSQRCHKQGGNGECQQCYSDSSRPLKKMKQGDNSHNPCWVRECLLPWQPLLPEGNLSSRMAKPQAGGGPGLSTPKRSQFLDTGSMLPWRHQMSHKQVWVRASWLQVPSFQRLVSNHLCCRPVRITYAGWGLVSTCLLGGDWSKLACLPDRSVLSTIRALK